MCLKTLYLVLGKVNMHAITQFKDKKIGGAENDKGKKTRNH